MTVNCVAADQHEVRIATGDHCRGSVMFSMFATFSKPQDIALASLRVRAQ